jgi:hypothetical protein
MQRQDFTDFDVFRTTIQQLDGGWLLNGGKDWRWHRTSLKVCDCEIQIGYSHSGLITEGVSSNDGYSFYVICGSKGFSNTRQGARLFGNFHPLSPNS